MKSLFKCHCLEKASCECDGIEMALRKKIKILSKSYSSHSVYFFSYVFVYIKSIEETTALQGADQLDARRAK